MTTIFEFLLARIAEDEEVARTAANDAAEDWAVSSRYEPNLVTDGGSAVAVGPWGGDIGPAAEHMARWDPARVLAECEAKRRLLDLHQIVTQDYTGAWWATNRAESHITTGCDHCRECAVDGLDYVVDGPCMTLRLLALPYSDHPDYREEWRP